MQLNSELLLGGPEQEQITQSMICAVITIWNKISIIAVTHVKWKLHTWIFCPSGCWGNNCNTSISCSCNDMINTFQHQLLIIILTSYSCGFFLKHKHKITSPKINKSILKLLSKNHIYWFNTIICILEDFGVHALESINTEASENGKHISK